MTEDDYRWLISGIKYLFEVDAQTPAQRSRLMALRRHVSQRLKEALVWQPRKPAPKRSGAARPRVWIHV